MLRGSQVAHSFAESVNACKRLHFLRPIYIGRLLRLGSRYVQNLIDFFCTVTPVRQGVSTDALPVSAL